MANKKTYVYKVKLVSNRDKIAETRWIYARNAKSAERYFKENVYPTMKYDKIDISLYGENPFTMTAPAIEFTEEETKMVEGYEAYHNQNGGLPYEGDIS